MIGVAVRFVCRFGFLGAFVLLGISSGGWRGFIGSVFLGWIIFRAAPGLWRDIRWVWSAGGKKFSSVRGLRRANSIM